MRRNWRGNESPPHRPRVGGYLPHGYRSTDKSSHQADNHRDKPDGDLFSSDCLQASALFGLNRLTPGFARMTLRGFEGGGLKSCSECF